MTLVLNLFGGPGVSKSTTAALAFGQLKAEGFNGELAHEYAKDLVWEERNQALGFTPYVHAKQLYRIHRLIGKVDFVITDSPPLMCVVYAQGKYGDSFEEYVISMHHSYTSLNFFLQRNPDAHPYQTAGRKQTEEEAIAIDRQVKDLLDRTNTPYIGVPVRNAHQVADEVVDIAKYVYNNDEGIGKNAKAS